MALPPSNNRGSNTNTSTNTSPVPVPDEKELQQRLKNVASRPENQKCCDCSDPRPTWATLIVPPPGSGGEKSSSVETIGAMCCYNCAGHHRSLGTHICRVKSCNLDTWKELEVIAMEVGGNARVNAIFEATMVFDSCKPDGRSDSITRMAFIREKYGTRNFYDGTQYKETHNNNNNSTMDNQNINSPWKGSKDTIKPGSFSSLTKNNNPMFNASFGGGGGHNSSMNGSFQESIGLDRFQQQSMLSPQPSRASLSYGDLFEPSEHHDDDEDDEDDEDDDGFLSLNHSQTTNDLTEDDDIDGEDNSTDDGVEDLFADSETTATDLFGSSTNYLKQKASSKQRSSLPPPPAFISEEDSVSEEWEAFTQTGNYMSPGVMSRKSVESTKSAPAAVVCSTRPNYGGKNTELWRNSNILSPTKSPSNSLGRIMTKQKLAVKNTRRSSVLSSLDSWLDPIAGGGEPQSIAVSSNAATMGTTQPHRHSTSSGHRSSLQPSKKTLTSTRKYHSERQTRSAAVDAFGFASSSDDDDEAFALEEEEEVGGGDEDVEGEFDLNASPSSGFGFESHFGDAGAFFSGEQQSSPGNLSIKSMPIDPKSALDSFLAADLEAGGGAGDGGGGGTNKGNSRRSSSGRRSSSRRDSGSVGSQGSYKSAPMSATATERRSSLRDRMKPPLTPTGAKTSSSSGSKSKSTRRLSGHGVGVKPSSATTSSASSASSSESPIGVMDLKTPKTTDTAEGTPEKSSRSERRSSRKGSRTSSSSGSDGFVVEKSERLSRRSGSRTTSSSSLESDDSGVVEKSERRSRRSGTRTTSTSDLDKSERRSSRTGTRASLSSRTSSDDRRSGSPATDRSGLPPSSPKKRASKTMTIKSGKIQVAV